MLTSTVSTPPRQARPSDAIPSLYNSLHFNKIVLLTFTDRAHKVEETEQLQHSFSRSGGRTVEDKQSKTHNNYKGQNNKFTLAPRRRARPRRAHGRPPAPGPARYILPDVFFLPFPRPLSPAHAHEEKYGWLARLSYDIMKTGARTRD